MAARNGPPIEPALRRALITLGPSTSNELADALQRDALNVTRCLMRMKKRGQVTSEPVEGSRFRHRWRLV